MQPFGYLEAAQFHPALSVVDRARLRFICGGIPLYLEYFSSDRSVEQNIARVILDEHGPLFREPDFLLREELREVEKYYTILMAIASGHATSQAISAQTGIDVRNLHYYLKQLMELGYVAQRHPLTGQPAVARHVRYAIDDALLRFWFRFVYPNSSFIASMGPERALKDRIRPHLDSFYGLGFERLCREALPVLYERESVTAAFDIGGYWDKHTQIDVVGRRDDGWIDLGECKWGTVRSLRGIAEEIEQRAARYPNPTNATICRRIFTRQAAAGSGSFRHHTLADLYGDHFRASTKRE